MKRMLQTDIVDIKTCKRLKAIDPEEIVDVVSKHVECGSTGLTRFLGRVADGTEGYVTIKVNKNSQYLKFQHSFYKVIKETVMTDIFEMANFQVKFRLKDGDFLRELSAPKLEEKGGLWRVKVQRLEDNEIGFVTLKGNQGATFLVNCDAPKVLPEKGDKDDEDEEMPPAAEEGVKKEDVKLEDVKMEKI